MTADAANAVTSGALPVAMAVALLAGLVSFASPCVLPLVPGFLGYVTGLSDESLAERKRHRMVLGALLFILGFTVVFMVDDRHHRRGRRHPHRAPRGADARRWGARHPDGAGLHRGRFPARAQAAPRVRRPGSPGRPLLGAVFGLGWAPCTGPTLGAVQVLATATGNQSAVTRGSSWRWSTRSDSACPFLLIAAGYERFGRVSAFLRKRQRGIQLFGGALLFVVGMLLVTGLWETITRHVADHPGQRIPDGDLR